MLTIPKLLNSDGLIPLLARLASHAEEPKLVIDLWI